LTGEVALRRRLRVHIARDSKSRDGGGENSQDWDERENPHGAFWGEKDSGTGEKSSRAEEKDEEPQARD
jgi:hypothetical protein